jgi:protein arginine N-methyltransferase 1
LLAGPLPGSRARLIDWSAQPEMYTIADYGAMIQDAARIDAFIRAFERVITPRTVVVDIGTGTGILSLLACRCGARRVYAIDPSDAIHVARQTAEANGYADRIECLQAVSTAVTLPEPADLIVSEIGGVLPWLNDHLTTIMDARTRFLGPGGTLMPRRDTLWMALVEAPDLYRRYSEPWSARPYGLDLSSAKPLVTNTWRQGRITADHLLAPLARSISIDYSDITSANLNAAVQWTVSRPGMAHGVGAGIDRILVDDIGFSNAPDRQDRVPADSIYRTAFFPWSSPVLLASGDVVLVELKAVLVGDDYVWNWRAEVLDQGRPNSLKARFDQSTLHGIPLSAVQLHKRAATHVPVLNEDGVIASLALDLMRRSITLHQIGEHLVERFPTRFPDPQRALAYVCDLSQRYSR